MEDKIMVLDGGVAVSNNQNLPNIEYISARHTGSVLAVLQTMRSCESLDLTPGQTAMARDIVRSIEEHYRYSSYPAFYLVRYGMLLGREKTEGRNMKNEES